MIGTRTKRGRKEGRMGGRGRKGENGENGEEGERKGVGTQYYQIGGYGLFDLFVWFLIY